MAHVGDVVFALERFEFSADDRLEVVGRWEGLEGRRMGRTALTVIEAGGKRRRLHALPGGQLTGGHPWRASFAWDGNGSVVESAELELGRRLVVELPPPRRRRRSGEVTPPPQPAVVPEGTDPREAEVTRLTDELAAAHRAAEELRERLEHEATSRATLEQMLAGSREQVAEARRALDAQREETERVRRDAAAAAAQRTPPPRRTPAAGAQRTPATGTHRVSAAGAHRTPVRAAHRVRTHGPTPVERWSARAAGALLSGLLLLALVLVVVAVA